MKGGSPYIYNILIAKKLIHNFTVLEQPWDVGFWIGCVWLTPGSCQALTELLPQHHPQGREGKTARKRLDQDKVGLRGEGKRKPRVNKGRGSVPPSDNCPATPEQPLPWMPNPFSSFYPSFYCSSQSTGMLTIVLATNPKHSNIQAATK